MVCELYINKNVNKKKRTTLNLLEENMGEFFYKLRVGKTPSYHSNLETMKKND